MTRIRPLADVDLRRSLKGAAYRSLQPIVLNALSVPAMAYIIRRLGADGYGEWTVATSLVATTAVLSSLGLRGPFVREVARHPHTVPTALAAQLGTRTLLTLATAVITLAAAIFLGYSWTVIACTAVAVVGLLLTSLATTGSDLMEGFQRLPTVAAANMVAGLLLTAASVLAVWLLPDPVLLSIVYLSGPLVLTVLFAYVTRRERVPIRLDLDVRHAARLMWNGRHFAVQQLVFAASANLALLMLPKLIGTAAFGLFSAGLLLVTRLAIFPDSISTAFYPLISRSVGRDPATVRHRVLSGVVLSVTLCGAVAAVVWWSSDLIARVLFPDMPDQCQAIIAITIWALPLIGLETMVSSSLNAAGLEASQARISIASASASLALGAVLITYWKIDGACWSTLARPAIQIGLLLPHFISMFVSVAPTRRDPVGRGSRPDCGGATADEVARVVRPTA